MKVRRIERGEGNGIYTCPFNFGRSITSLAHNLGLRNMYSMSFGIGAFAITQLIFRKNAIISFACGVIGCVVTNNAIKVFKFVTGVFDNNSGVNFVVNEERNEEEQDDYSSEGKEFSKRFFVPRNFDEGELNGIMGSSTEEINPGESSLETSSLSGKKSINTPCDDYELEDESVLLGNTIEGLVEEINSGKEMQSKLVSAIVLMKRQKDYNEKLILTKLNKIRDSENLKKIFLMLTHDKLLNFKSIVYLPEQIREEFKDHLEKIVLEHLKTWFSPYFTSHVYSISGKILEYMNDHVPFSLIDTEEVFISVVSKILEHILSLTEKKAKGRRDGLNRGMHRRLKRYLDPLNASNFNGKQSIKLDYFKENLHIFITGEKRACRAINRCESVAFVMHAYKFLLRRMFNNKEKLSKEEFSKHEQFLTLKINNFRNLNAEKKKEVYENIIPFLEAICDYFNPAENLVTEEMAGEISKLIDDNINVLVDFENLTKQQEIRLSKAFSKLGIQEEFCDNVDFIIYDLKERLSFVHENINTNAIYSEEELQQRTFDIRMLSCPVISVNPLFLKMNF